MPNIRVLSPHIANQIAAGEVVERPCSVVKELVENAVDAKSTAISVQTMEGGLELIRVTDNGGGISDADCETAFLRHATSKISTSDDLGRIMTLGFRGEALASIAAVSRTTITTRTADDELGTQVTCEYGQIVEHKRIGSIEGTTVQVQNLFSNVPARKKFLKSVRSENGAIGDYMASLILSLPDIAFHYQSYDKTVYRTAGDGDLKNAIVAVYGVSTAPHLCPVLFDDGYIKIDGYIGTPELSRSNRSGQSFFLNRRIIRSTALSLALMRAYDTRLMVGRYAFAVLNIHINAAEVDVNVHPAKLEVRFADEQRVVRSVYAACADALARGYVPSVQTPIQEDMQGHHPTTETDFRRVELRDAVPREPYAVRETGAHPNSPASPRYYNVTVPRDIQRPQQSTLFSQAERPFSSPYHLVGVAFDTYWIVQQDESVLFIDQHAAHERILYDRLMNRETEVVSQTLLMPEALTLLPSERALLDAQRADLEAFGYAFADGEGGKLLLLAVPQLNATPLKAAFLLDVLHQKDTQRSALTQQACKHAVKAGEPIGREQMTALIEALTANETLLTCPHGRPIAVRMTKTELEKMFKRLL